MKHYIADKSTQLEILDKINTLDDKTEGKPILFETIKTNSSRENNSVFKINGKGKLHLASSSASSNNFSAYIKVIIDGNLIYFGKASNNRSGAGIGTKEFFNCSDVESAYSTSEAILANLDGDLYYRKVRKYSKNIDNSIFDGVCTKLTNPISFNNSLEILSWVNDINNYSNVLIGYELD